MINLIFIEEIERKEKFQNVANMFKNIVLANRQINAVFICASQYAKKQRLIKNHNFINEIQRTKFEKTPVAL